MSDLIISPNLFLGVNELDRLKKSLREDGYKRISTYLTNSFGIAQDANNTFFKVTQLAGSNNTVVINKGVAFDSSLNAIVLENDTQLTIPNTGITQWIAISYVYTNIEKGTINVSALGSITGIGTEFLSVLRGQPDFPTKVQLVSELNTGEYEVVDVTSDTSATLSGDFVAESGIQYKVIGTFTPGFQVDDDNKFIYQYDSCSIRLIASEDVPTVGADEFLIASVSYDGVGAMYISDERVRNMFNNPYEQSGGTEDAAAINPLVSLISVGTVGKGETSVDMELLMEAGYSVTRYELVTTSTSNTLNILEGNCNFLGTGDIPNGMFTNWRFLNRKNMKFATIQTNQNKTLYIPVLDSSLFETEGNDFIIVPPFKEIEYQVTVSNNVDRPSTAFYFRGTLQNLVSRGRIYIYYPDQKASFVSPVTVSLRYRMIGEGTKNYVFSKFAVAQFENYMSQNETLADSSFDIDIASMQPIEKLRNYS
jgi:hypothetical protein